MYASDTQRDIRVGQAFNLAFKAALLENPGDIDAAIAAARNYAVGILDSLNAVQEAVQSEQKAEAQRAAQASYAPEGPHPAETVVTSYVQGAAGPARQLQPSAPVTYSPDYQSAPPPPPPPPGGFRQQPGGGAPKGDELWALWVQSPGDFYDNTKDKRSAQAADFRHKSLKEAKGYPAGLWINSKFGSPPQFALDALRQRGYIQ